MSAHAYPQVIDTGAASAADLLGLYQANRLRFVCAGWSRSRFMALPGLAVAAVLFPPEPPDWAPEAGAMPLLPRQAAVAARLAAAEARVRPPRDPQPTGPRPPRPAASARLPAVRNIATTGPSAVRYRGGALVEPLKHSTVPRHRRYPSSPRFAARMIGQLPDLWRPT